jgi:hypothetical protein
MARSNGTTQADRWRAVLRSGDPLEDGSDLTEAQSRHLRTRILCAADGLGDAQPRGFRLRAIAIAACAATLVIAGMAGVAWFGGWKGRSGDGSASSRPHALASATAPERADIRAGKPSVAPAPESTDTLAVPRPEIASRRLVAAARRPTRLATRNPLGVTGSAGEQLDSARPRQVQFTTPGGTRIMWVLDPNFTLTPVRPLQEDLRWSGE